VIRLCDDFFPLLSVTGKVIWPVKTRVTYAVSKWRKKSQIHWQNCCYNRDDDTEFTVNEILKIYQYLMKSLAKLYGGTFFTHGGHWSRFLPSCVPCGPEAILPLYYPFTFSPFTLSFSIFTFYYFSFLLVLSIFLLFRPFPFYQNTPTTFPGRMLQEATKPGFSFVYVDFVLIYVFLVEDACLFLFYFVLQCDSCFPLLQVLA